MIQSGDQSDGMNRTSTKQNLVIESKGRALPVVCLWCCEVRLCHDALFQRGTGAVTK